MLGWSVQGVCWETSEGVGSVRGGRRGGCLEADEAGCRRTDMRSTTGLGDTWIRLDGLGDSSLWAIAFDFPFESGLGVIPLVLDEAGAFSQSSRSPVLLRFFALAFTPGLICIPSPSSSNSWAAAPGSPFDLTSASRISLEFGCVLVFSRLDTRASSVSVSSDASMVAVEQQELITNNDYESRFYPAIEQQ